MIQLTHQELKDAMVSIMKSIDKFCKEHSLRYYLAFGSLIGAVRHQGFIPWDDDIDIWMPRTDYERFISEYSDENYKVLCASKEKDYPLDFAKLSDSRTVVTEEGGDGKWGVFVDIFPLDGVPSREEGLKVFKKVRLLRRFAANQRFTKKFKIKKQNGISKNVAIVAGKLMSPFLSLNKILLKEDKIMKRYMDKRCSCYTDLCVIEALLIFDKELFDQTVSLPFEGEYFRVPKEYDKILTHIYGDYMTLPPEEKRVSNHGIKAYWIK